MAGCPAPLGREYLTLLVADAYIDEPSRALVRATLLRDRLSIDVLGDIDCRSAADVFRPALAVLARREDEAKALIADLAARGLATLRDPRRQVVTAINVTVTAKTATDAAKELERIVDDASSIIYAVAATTHTVLTLLGYPSTLLTHIDVRVVARNGTIEAAYMVGTISGVAKGTAGSVRDVAMGLAKQLGGRRALAATLHN